jgi:hypothetical protein
VCGVGFLCTLILEERMCYGRTPVSLHCAAPGLLAAFAVSIVNTLVAVGACLAAKQLIMLLLKQLPLRRWRCVACMHMHRQL